MSLAYDEYLAEHIGNVNRGLHWMLDNLPLTQEEKSAIETAMVEFRHDDSKYDTAEYDPYDQYFYGGNQSYAVKLAFDYAWLHHIHHNPHHWQYWVLLEDDPETGVVPFKTLQIPLPYIFEMIADWWTFSWKNNNLFEIFDWYADHRHKQYIHPESRMILENILKKIWNVLVMQETVAGHDVSEIEAQYMRVWAEEEPEAFNYHFISKGEPSDNVSMKESNEPVPGIPSTLPGIGWLGHSGIKGQKWGVRRFQNYDGSLTEAGKERYRKTVFVSGSGKTQSKDSPYYRKELPKEVKNELNKHMNNHDKILVGDAPGIDRQVQDYLNSKNYDDVEIYGPGKQVRYSANENWKTTPTDDPDHEVGSKEWLAKKDIAMSNAADEGLAVILDEGAKATRNNIARMLEDEKDVKVFELSKDGPSKDGMHVINQLFKERRDILDRKLDDDFDQELVDLIGYEMLDSLGLHDEVENWLGHSGIKGQKWGIRNGPPYPLSVERNSKVRMNYIRDSKWIRTHQVPQSELERHPIEKLSDLRRLTKNDDIADVRWRVNAMKDNFIGRYYNCQNCAAAFDMIERGYNVCARPKQSGSNVGNIEDLYEGGHLSHCEMDKQLSDYEDAYQARREVGNKLVSELLSQGSGARGILVVGQAKDRDMEDTSQCSGFHAINYKVENESQGFLKGTKPVVKIYDMQSSHDYYHKGTSDYVTVFFDSDPRDIYFMRTDNLEPSDLMTTAVYSQNGIGELDYDKK